VLLDSGAMEMFMDQKMVAKHGFSLQKLKRLVMVRNVDQTNNSRGAITHQVEVNVYYRNHVEKMRMTIYNLGKTNVILEILWLQVHNPEINWEIEEIKKTRCLPIYGRTMKEKENRKVKKGKRVAILEEEKIVR